MFFVGSIRQRKEGCALELTDNREIAEKQKNMQMMLNKKSHLANATMQLVRNVNQAPVNFIFDGTGTKTAPIGAGQTNPVGRSAWPNQMIADNLITHANNNAMYQSGHQVAHRFGGSDNGDNVAAWPDIQEAAYSIEEDRIDQGLAAPRINETGILNVTTGYRNAGIVLTDMVNACYGASNAHLQTTGNWDNLNPNSLVVHPLVAPPQNTIEAALQNKFNTQQYGMTDANVAETVTMNYAAQNAGIANNARSFNYNNNAIPLPTWTNTALTWQGYLLANRPPVIQEGGNRFRLAR